ETPEIPISRPIGKKIRKGSSGQRLQNPREGFALMTQRDLRERLSPHRESPPPGTPPGSSARRAASRLRPLPRRTPRAPSVSPVGGKWRDDARGTEPPPAGERPRVRCR